MILTFTTCISYINVYYEEKINQKIQPIFVSFEEKYDKLLP